MSAGKIATNFLKKKKEERKYEELWVLVSGTPAICDVINIRHIVVKVPVSCL